MLCFVFAALIVALDQFFKRWIMRTLDIGEIGPEVIPGIMGLTRWENDGAMLNILSGQQWLLAGIAFVATLVLIMILLRYNEGFWGTIGLAAVLGGTIGNLIDRIFNDGKVVDMFMTLFIPFPIFNIADIFITLGFIIFLIHFIAVSFKAEQNERVRADYDTGDYYEGHDEQEYDEFPEIDSIVSEKADNEVGSDYRDVQQQDTYQKQYTQTQSQFPEPEFLDSDLLNDDYGSVTDTTDVTYSLDDLESELGSLDDYNVDDILREYGFEDD